MHCFSFRTSFEPRCWVTSLQIPEFGKVKWKSRYPKGYFCSLHSRNKFPIALPDQLNRMGFFPSKLFYLIQVIQEVRKVLFGTTILWFPSAPVGRIRIHFSGNFLPFWSYYCLACKSYIFTTPHEISTLFRNSKEYRGPVVKIYYYGGVFEWMLVAFENIGDCRLPAV